MNWNFTPEDVLTGKAYYNVAKFRDDLLEEIRRNRGVLGGDDMTNRVYAIITVMLCSSLAFGKTIDSFVASFKKCFPGHELQKFLTGDRKLLEHVRTNNQDNIKMLKAVIHRRIQDDGLIGIEPDCTVTTITTELMSF
ncbi:MAG: hypothetical protein WA610_14185 [Thermodesulfovibrionales bacterium]